MKTQHVRYSFGTAMLAAALAITALALPASASSQPHMVANLETTAAGSDPAAITDVDGTAYFFACDGSHLMALYTTDDSGPGTTRVKTVGNCGESDKPAYDIDPVAVGSRLFFTTRDSNLAGDTLWVSDGTPGGTSILNDDLLFPDWLTDVDGTLYFSNGNGLWTSDGTPEGTVLIKPGRAMELVAMGGTLYFDHNGDLWTSDGTPEGTVLVNDVTPSGRSSFSDMIVAGSRLFFVANPGTDGSQLWTSDGSEGGTHRVKNIDTSGPDKVGSLVALGNEVFFVSRDATHGKELWITDGTSTGTRMVKDIASPGSSDPRNLIAVGDRVSFTADDGIHGRELWASDGTAPGTTVVKDIIPSHDPYQPTYQAAIGTTLFFSAVGPDGDELWSSDGTPLGTDQAADINAGGDSSPRFFTTVGDQVLFSADDGIHGVELWTSDAAATTVALVKDVNAADLGSNPVALASLGPNVVFSAGSELWATDGTEPQTVMLHSFYQETPTTSQGGFLYFAADDGTHGVELWRTDGTPGGTGQVTDATPGPDSSLSYASLMASAGGKVYFTDLVGTLWVSDGTGPGTMPLTSGPTPGSIRDLTRVGTKLFFTVSTPCAPSPCYGESVRLWKTDGTVGGTRRVSSKDFGLGYSSLTAVGHTLYLVYESSQLWASDGTAAGTRRVRTISSYDPLDNVTSAGGRLFFSANPYDSGADDGVPQLWTSDGTKAGTKPLGTFATGRRLGEVTAVGSSVYFAADDGTNGCCGYQLWRSDGSVVGTTKVSDKFFGPSSSGYPYSANPSGLTNFGGTLYFAAQDAADTASGMELWTSDGTDGGTIQVADIDPNGSSSPTSLLKAGDSLYFTADDGEHGAELWQYTP